MIEDNTNLEEISEELHEGDDAMSFSEEEIQEASDNIAQIGHLVTHTHNEGQSLSELFKKFQAQMHDILQQEQEIADEDLVTQLAMEIDEVLNDMSECIEQVKETIEPLVQLASADEEEIDEEYEIEDAFAEETEN